MIWVANVQVSHWRHTNRLKRNRRCPHELLRLLSAMRLLLGFVRVPRKIILSIRRRTHLSPLKPVVSLICNCKSKSCSFHVVCPCPGGSQICPPGPRGFGSATKWRPGQVIRERLHRMLFPSSRDDAGNAQ